ncbi:transcriptional regulator [Lysinibacter sp. HNR]|uniref:transcriptional regulator n=1 Tax=Lysinibacter sp. HNR TaxID=3031408 RepID=UPI002435C350|nr:transcriptional regulator [Lysinibacter sp. HNR]WGD37858.1 transcriptional regulator [Lysinibacter sp. HNR]
MVNQRFALRRGESVRERRRLLLRAHEKAVSGAEMPDGIRDVVRDSWQRSIANDLDPEGFPVTDVWDFARVDDYRNSHPLASIRPIIQRLLIDDAAEADLIVAVGDAAGRLLWIDGDYQRRVRAEDMNFVVGADWSEAVVGMSALGSAITLNHGIQVLGEEHYNRRAHQWSCTAAPIHDPVTKTLLGVIDITGGDEIVAPHTLPLVEATVAAVEAELRIQTLRKDMVLAQARRGPWGISDRKPVKGTGITRLNVLGRERGELYIGTEFVELSRRHAEILTLLAWHENGLSAERLSQLLYGRNDGAITLRAEMVRLRSVLKSIDPTLTPLSRPYRLPRSITLDVRDVLSALGRGAHRLALAAYPGVLLPESEAPGITYIRAEVARTLREALLTDASIEVLLSYVQSPVGTDDRDAWEACLRLLPARSPKRAHVLSRLEMMDTRV